MLIPITRAKFEQIIPLIATGAQYIYYWGGINDILRRALISVVIIIVLFIIGQISGAGEAGIILLLQVIFGLYWLWSPVYWASIRNNKYRKFPYSGFWRGEILDVFITEDLIAEEETVNKQGELVIVENRERRINIEIGDEIGAFTIVKAPLKRIHKVIKTGEVAELLVLSNKPDLSKISAITDVYLPRYNLWIGLYPYLQRDIFAQVSEELGGIKRTKSPQRDYTNVSRKRRYK
jgi:hypothetical protein